MNTAPDRSGATNSVDALPFEVMVEGPGFRLTARYATQDEAYTEARRIRDERSRNEVVAFRTKRGETGLYAIGAVRIHRWNPLTLQWASHAEPWNRLHPNPGCLTPLPRDWHGTLLPNDWYADPEPRPIAD